MFLPQSSEVAIDAAMAALNRHGLHVVRSFDLKQALGSREDPCGKPVNGSVVCDCQYVVLLAYRGGEGPVVVTAHSDLEATYLRVLPGTEGHAGPRLRARVETALRLLEWRIANPVQGGGR